MTTIGKDDDSGKDNDSKEDSDDGKENNNDGSNGNSCCGSISAGSGQGNVRLVAVLCCALVAWHLRTIGIIRNIKFGSKLV
jgi:hypothetical protein